MKEHHCPYCGSENISYEDSRLDYTYGVAEEILMETDFCKCEDCEKKFNIETDLMPSAYRYYNPSTCERIKENF